MGISDGAGGRRGMEKGEGERWELVGSGRGVAFHVNLG